MVSIANRLRSFPALGVLHSFFVPWLFCTPFLWNHWNNMIWLMEGENARLEVGLDELMQDVNKEELVNLAKQSRPSTESLDTRSEELMSRFQLEPAEAVSITPTTSREKTKSPEIRDDNSEE
jgi:hypothetical protein